MTSTKVQHSAVTDPDRRSERNSESCERHAEQVAPIANAQCASFLQPESVSSVLPVLAAGAAQRDERELAPDTFEPDFSDCHRTDVDEESPFQEASESDSGAVVPLQLETRGITSQKNKSYQRELWCRQTVHKNTIAVKLREVGEEWLALQLEKCHSEATWATCTDCGKSKRFLNRCERFYCPECQPTLSRDRERSVGWWAREVSQPKHVVLTLQNFPILTKNIVKTAKKCFDRLRRRKFAKNWLGGFYSWEVTKEIKGTYKRGHVCEGGWHLHLHALVDCRYIDAVQLSEEWNKVTGGQGRIVKVKDARNHDYIKEVTKYAVKGSQLAAWTGDEIKMFIDAFDGVRTFGVFGSLYGKRTEFREWLKELQSKPLKCECGCSEWWYRDDATYQLSDVMPLEARPPPAIPAAQLSFSV